MSTATVEPGTVPPALRGTPARCPECGTAGDRYAGPPAVSEAEPPVVSAVERPPP